MTLSHGDLFVGDAIPIASRNDDGHDATSIPNADADCDAPEGEVADGEVLDRDAVEEKVVPAAA